jgi:hypothetical protein
MSEGSKNTVSGSDYYKYAWAKKLNWRVSNVLVIM